MNAAARRIPRVIEPEKLETGPTPERMQHDPIEERDILGMGRAYTVVRQAWIIDTYYKRNTLGYSADQNERNYEAASKFHALAEKCAERSPASCLTNIDRIRGTGPGPEVMASRDEMNRLREFVGPTSWECLDKVVFENWSADDWARHRGITRPRVGIDMLRLALDDAGKFWRAWKRGRG